jgi:biotin transport system substrate-specific component
MKTDALASAVRPGVDASLSVWRCALAVVGFAVLTALCSHVIIPLPHTPVPITLQTLVVALAGLTLGWRLGLASMAFYLLLGTAGYHVFAGGNWGLETVFGATGGYLVGFALAQPIFGWFAHTRRIRWYEAFGLVLAGHALIFASGLLWLSLWLGTGAEQTLALGFWPFLPGCALKTAAAVALAGPARRHIPPLLHA